MHKACPIKIVKLPTDNGEVFTDHLFANHECEPSGNPAFDLLCEQLRIEPRPRATRTNGMVRFNGRIIGGLKTHRVNSDEDLEQTLLCDLVQPPMVTISAAK